MNTATYREPVAIGTWNQGVERGLSDSHFVNLASQVKYFDLLENLSLISEKIPCQRHPDYSTLPLKPLGFRGNTAEQLERQAYIANRKAE